MQVFFVSFWQPKKPHVWETERWPDDQHCEEQQPKKTAPADPPLVPAWWPHTSNTRLDSIFVEGILNLRPRHSIRPHIKQTIWGQMDFPHIIVKLSLCCGFRHFWHNDFWRHLLKLFLLVALLALQVPLQYRTSREGDALVLRDPKCELVLSWTASLF